MTLDRLPTGFAARDDVEALHHFELANKDGEMAAAGLADLMKGGVHGPIEIGNIAP